MTFRLFHKTSNLYTNSPFWPSNQRTTSEFVLRSDGKILEIINFGDSGDGYEIKEHDSRNFEVEPWTGFFDSRGKKIYRGDIIKLDCFDIDYKVIWKFDRFSIEALLVLAKYDDGVYVFPHDVSSNYSVIGNVHGVEYAD